MCSPSLQKQTNAQYFVKYWSQWTTPSSFNLQTPLKDWGGRNSESLSTTLTVLRTDVKSYYTLCFFVHFALLTWFICHAELHPFKQKNVFSTLV